MPILPGFEIKSAESERDCVQVFQGFDGLSNEESPAPNPLRDLAIAEIALLFYAAALEELRRLPW